MGKDSLEGLQSRSLVPQRAYRVLSVRKLLPVKGRRIKSLRATLELNFFIFTSHGLGLHWSLSCVGRNNSLWLQLCFNWHKSPEYDGRCRSGLLHLVAQRVSEWHFKLNPFTIKVFFSASCNKYNPRKVTEFITVVRIRSFFAAVVDFYRCSNTVLKQPWKSLNHVISVRVCFPNTVWGPKIMASHYCAPYLCSLYGWLDLTSLWCE